MKIYIYIVSFITFLSCGASKDSLILSKSQNNKNTGFIKQEIVHDINDRYERENYEKLFYYRIQILALENSIYTEDLKLFLGFVEKEIYFNHDTKLTGYLVGKFTKYSDAFFLKEYMVHNGLKDAFIVGFINKKRMSDINEVLKLEQKDTEIIFTENTLK